MGKNKVGRIIVPARVRHARGTEKSFSFHFRYWRYWVIGNRRFQAITRGDLTLNEMASFRVLGIIAGDICRRFCSMLTYPGPRDCGKFFVLEAPYGYCGR